MRRNRVVNANHEMVVLTPLQQSILRELDGTRDQAALRRHFRATIPDIAVLHAAWAQLAASALLRR
jgi:hypothetical protein